MTKGACWSVDGSGFYGELFTPQEILDMARYAQDPDLDDEIGILKVLIRQVVRAEEDPSKSLALITRAVGQLTRSLKARRALSGETADGLAGAIGAALDEVGNELGLDL
jgi:hypothetical protein